MTKKSFLCTSNQLNHCDFTCVMFATGEKKIRSDFCHYDDETTLYPSVRLLCS